MLERLGIAPRAFRALLHALVAMDLRGFHYGRATGTKAGSVISPLFWVLGQFLFLSALVSAALFARVDVRFFAFAGLATSMLLVFSAIVVEFHEAVLNPADTEILGHRPLEPRTYAAARMGNLIFYVALMSVALTIFPAVMGAGLRDAGPGFLPAYVFASLLANLFTAGAVVCFYTLFVRGGAFETAKNVLAWVQIILIMVVFYGAQLMLRNATGSFELFAARPPGWIEALPPWWLASFVTGVAAAPALSHLGFAAAATALAVLVCALAVGRLSTAYKAVHAEAAAWRRSRPPVPARKGTVARERRSPFLRGRAEALGYWLTRTMLKRDVDLKMRAWPAFGVAVAAVFLGLLSGEWTDPLRVRGSTSVLPLVVIPLVASAFPIVAFNLSFSRDHAAAWLLRGAPLRHPERFTAGVRKALLYAFFLPVMALLFLIFWLSWGHFFHALVHAGIGWLVLEATARVSFVVAYPGVPFSQPLTRGATLGKIGIVSGFVLAGATLLAYVHYLAARDAAWLLAYVAALVLGVWVLDRWSAGRVEARLKRSWASA